EPAPRFTTLRRIGNPSARWFQTDHAAIRRWPTNRSAAVAALRQRTQARGDLRRRTAARSARVVLEIPRIARHRAEAAFSGGTSTEFRRTGRAEQNPAGVMQTLRDHSLLGRKEILVIARAKRGGDPERRGQILERVRNAVKRHRRCLSSRRLEPGSVRQRAIRGDRHVCAELRISALDSCEIKLSDLARTNLILQY